MPAALENQALRKMEEFFLNEIFRREEAVFEKVFGKNQIISYDGASFFVERS